MRRGIHWTATTILVVALTTAIAWGSIQARVSGTVSDSAGRPIPNATVTITCPELQAFKKELETDEKGSYKVLLLDSTKAYRYRVEADGYRPVEITKKVPAGSTDNEVDFTLKTVQEENLTQPGFRELEQARTLAREGRLEEARSSAEAACELMPDSVEAWTLLCEVEHELADHTAALEHAERCLQLDEQAIPCVAVAANSARELGMTDKHTMYIGRYQELNPDDPTAVFNEAVAHLNALDDEKARPLLERCLAIDPDFPKCLYEYGMMLLRSGDLEGAKRHLERYLEVDPDGADAATAAETIKYL